MEPACASQPTRGFAAYPPMKAHLPECRAMPIRRIAPGGWRLVASVFLVCAVLLGLTGQAMASGGSLSGTAVYSDMSPASRVLAFVIPANVTGSVQPYETLTNAQGEWSLSSIPPGEYRVDMIVVPASGTHETRSSQTVNLAEGQSIALGAIDVGAPTVSEAKTEAEIRAELAEVGTLIVTVRTAEGKPAEGAMLSIQDATGGSTSGVPPSGVVSVTARPGPAMLSVTDTPPDSATQVSASAQATVVANVTTSVTLTLPPSSPLALPAGITAHNSERDLSYLNAERARWGLPSGLTLNPAWSQACAAHDAYLADNKRLEHPEDSSLPGASPGGAWAGLHSILSDGGWVSEANPWENAPIHLDQLYTPDLAVVGIDESRGVACTTTWPGIGPPLQPGGTVSTYPGDGTSGFPPSEVASELPFTPNRFVGIREGTVTGRDLLVYEDPDECSGIFCADSSTPNLESATLMGPGGRVEVRTVGGETGEVGSYLTGAIVIPVKPLEPNASYTAEVTLAANGGLPAETHRWSFRTGPANPGGVWPVGHSSAREVLPPRRRISKLTLTPRTFADGRHHSGTRVTYLDSGSGRTGFVVYRRTAGMFVGAQCASATVARGGRCTRLSRIYSFSHRDRPGKNSLRLTGHYGHSWLAAGKYVLAVIGFTSISFTVRS
jgi:hypothetical protein